MSARLLFDQNISWRILALIKDEFSNSSHVDENGLSTASDREVWDFARRNDFCIVSKDADFRQLSFLYGSPPKAVWLRLGNCSVSELARCTKKNAATIRNFLDDLESAFLILG